MFLPLCVCLFVCLFARLLNKLWTDYNDFWRDGRDKRNNALDIGGDTNHDPCPVLSFKGFFIYYGNSCRQSRIKRENPRRKCELLECFIVDKRCTMKLWDPPTTGRVMHCARPSPICDAGTNEKNALVLTRRQRTVASSERLSNYCSGRPSLGTSRNGHPRPVHPDRVAAAGASCLMLLMSKSRFISWLTDDVNRRHAATSRGKQTFYTGTWCTRHSNDRSTWLAWHLQHLLTFSWNTTTVTIILCCTVDAL